MLLQHLILEAVLIDHDLEVDVDVLTALEVDNLALLLLFLHGFHIQAAFLPLLLELLDFVQGVAWLRRRWWLVARLHRTSPRDY